MPIKIADPTPAWLKPENASVLDSPWTRTLRFLGHVIGADDPQAQAFGLMTSEIPAKGNLAQLAVNASGESAASQEAMNRLASMKAKGEQFVVIGRGGGMRPLIGPEAVDYVPRPGEKFGIHGPQGFRLLSEGTTR